MDTRIAQAVADVLSELPVTLFASLDPLVQASVLEICATGHCQVDLYVDREDVVRGALDVVDRKLGQLCRFFDVESIEDVEVESVDEVMEELERVRESRAEWVVRVEDKAMAVVQVLAMVVEKVVLGERREWEDVREESMVESVRMLALLVRRLVLRLEIAFADKGVGDIDKEIEKKLQRHGELKEKVRAYRDLALNPRYAEIKRQYQETLKRIEAFKL
jgi:hypothetical protein